MTRDRDERISGYLDGELDPDERAAFEDELARSPALARELEAMREMMDVTDSVQLREFPDRVWNTYWYQTYNRIERRIGWIIFSIGSAILIGGGLYELARDLLRNTSEPWWVRAAVGMVAFGFAILFVSVARERLFRHRRDPYREVKR